MGARMRFASVATLAAYIDGLADGSIVGLVGPPGAGKSTVASDITSLVAGSSVLPMDGYHYPQAELRRLGRRDRMGAADTFDVPAFVNVLRRIRSASAPDRHPGHETAAVLARGFDRRIEEPVEDAVAVDPSFRTLLVEGNYLLLDSGGWDAVAPLLDATVYLQVGDDIRHERLIARHIAFGKSPDAARAWALGTDEANARIVAATAHRADHVLALD